MGHTARCVLIGRYSTVSILPVSSILPLMHDAFFARSALRLRHRRPAQSCVSPQQPPHVLCPHLRSDDNIRRRPSTLWPPTSGGARAPKFARIDAGRSNVGRHGVRDARLRAHGLLPVLVRELTEPTPYGPDGEEGDGFDADLKEKLIRCVS